MQALSVLLILTLSFLFFNRTDSAITISGSAVSSPLHSSVDVQVDGSFNPTMSYFIFRSSEKLKFVKFMPYLTVPGPSIISPIQFLSETTPGQAQLFLSHFEFSDAQNHNIQVWSGLPLGYGVTTTPPGYQIDYPNLTSFLTFENDPDFKFHRINDFSEFETVFGNSVSYYGSIIVTTIFNVQAAELINCYIKVIFSGKAYFYLNGKFIGFGNSIFEDAQTVFIIPEAFINLYNEELNLFQIFGISLIVHAIEASECTNYQNQDAEGTLNIYSPITSEAEITSSPLSPISPDCVPDCKYCLNFACVFCHQDLISTYWECLPVSNPYHRFQNELGIINFEGANNQFFIQNLAFINNKYQADLRYLGPAPPSESYYLTATFQTGASGNWAAIIPRKLKSKITWRTSALTSLSIDQELLGTQPLSVFLIRFGPNTFTLGQTLFSYYYLEVKPTSTLMLEGKTLLMTTNTVTADQSSWYYVICYYKPGSRGSKITFSVDTPLPLETYINGEHWITSPVNGIVQGFIQPNHTAELYYVIYIFKSEGSTTFQEYPSVVTDPDELALGMAERYDQLLEYHFCGPSLYFDSMNNECVASCPAGSIVSNKMCINPCTQNYKLSSNPALNCKSNLKKRYSGPAIDSPTLGQDLVLLNGMASSADIHIFALRYLENFFLYSFASAFEEAPVMSHLRKLNRINDTTVQGNLAPVGFSAETTFLINVFLAKKGGWTVTAFSHVCGLTGISYSIHICQPDGYTLVPNLNFEKDIPFGDELNGIPYAASEYGSILAARIIALDEATPDSTLYCKIKILFNGNAYIFLNGKHLGSTNYYPQYEEGYYVTQGYSKFTKIDYQLLQIFGVEMTKLAIRLVDCMDPLNNFITYQPELDIYSHTVDSMSKYFMSSSLTLAPISNVSDCPSRYESSGYCHDCGSKCNNDREGGCTVTPQLVTFYDRYGVDVTGTFITGLTVNNFDVSNIFSFTDVECMKFISSTEWTQLAGKQIDLKPYFSSPVNSSIYIPYCSLVPNHQYIFTISVLHSVGGMPTDYTLNINTAAPPLQVELLGAESTQPVGSDLKLFAVYMSNCPALDTVEYMWSCQLSADGVNFQPCPNPGTYDTYGPDDYLTIPSTDLTGNSIMRVTVTIRYAGITRSKTREIRINSKIPLDVSLICLDCKTHFDGDIDINLLSTVQSVSNYEGLSFNWTFIPSIKNVNYLNQAKVFHQELPITHSKLYIQVHVSNVTHEGYALFSIPLNTIPFGGRCDVTPTFGSSLSTIFYMWCEKWFDSDAPLKYQFFVSYDNETFYQIAAAKNTTSLESTLSAIPPSSIVYIKAVIADKLDGKAEVIIPLRVQSKYPSFSLSLNNMQNLLQNTLNSLASSADKLQQVSLIVQELSNLESTLFNISDNPCPTCNGNGSCNDADYCLCNSGWSLPDCSISNSAYNEITKLTKDLVNALNSTYSSILQSKEEYIDLYLSMLQLLSNPYFNSEDIFIEIHQILTETLDLNNQSVTLSTMGLKTLTALMDNTMNYLLNEGCDQNPDLTKLMNDNLEKYFDIISRSSLRGKLPNEDPTVIIMDNFDVYVGRMPLCNLTSTTISTSSDAPEIELELRDTTRDPCQTPNSDVREVSYFALLDGLSNCTRGKTKSVVAIKVTDPDQGTSDDLIVNLRMPAGSNCPKECSAQNGVCTCEDISIFDVKKQLSQIFKNSRLSDLTQISSLANWKFYKSFVFWVTSGYTFTFLASIVAIKFFIKDFCLYTKFMKNRTMKTSALKIGLTGFVVNIQFIL